MKRSSGILLPISALPSPHGVGTLGKAAYDFADFLHAAGQSYWQMLPLGPTGYGDSPYQSFSTFAGNPYFIDLDLLIEDGLLTKQELSVCDRGDPARVDYGMLYETRFDLLKKAKRRGWERDRGAVAAFERENAEWLPDYALFMAIKRSENMRPWAEWPEALRLREPEALERSRAALKEDIELYVYIQFLFFRQWEELKTYINKLGIRIIGDLPIYVSPDSADVWAAPQFFQLDKKNVPVEVAGVPPDFFTADGQLWGNPLYDYDAMRRTGYNWWIRRVAGAGRLFDMIRIDHFRAFESYWAVPYGEKTAKNGRWVKGPGLDLVKRLTDWFHDVSFIAEDLGVITPEVTQLRKDSGLPGMKVLQFAFDAKSESDYLPHNHVENCVCYTGTHDNTTLKAWFQEAKPAEVKKAIRYLGLNEEEGFCEGMLRGGMASTAELFIAQMQDWLQLGAEARMNTPGKPDGNWRWRMLPRQTTKKLAKTIKDMTSLYGRCKEEDDAR